MSDMPWFRFYSEALADRKLARVCRTTQQPKALVIGVWATLLCLASESPARGSLMMSDGLWLQEEEIAAETGLDPDVFARIVGAFRDLGMVSIIDGRWQIPNWTKRQYASDSSTERVREHRRRRREAKREAKREVKQVAEQGETLQERFGNGLDTDTDTETEGDARARARARENGASPESAPDGALPPNAFFELQAAVCQAVRKQPLMLTKPESRQIEAMFSAGITPEDVDQAVAFFGRQDWRGKKGEPLTLRILGDIVGHAKEWDPHSRTSPVLNGDRLWDLIYPLMTQHGARDKPDLAPELESAVARAGGWATLCRMEIPEARRRLVQAVPA